MTGRGTAALHALAHDYGIQTAYYDTDHRRVPASPDALLAALRVIGAPVQRLEDVPAALVERERSRWLWRVEPVTVSWEGLSPAVFLRLPATEASGTLHCRLQTEDGAVREWTTDIESLAVTATVDVDGARHVEMLLPLPGPLPLGYHDLTLTASRRTLTTMLIAAPARAYTRPGATKRWGVFIPLYALRSERDWGVGDLTDLGRVGDWVSDLGGDVVATLPMLASFLHEPLAYSPYTPVSRLFWNEMFLDPEAIVGSPAAAGISKQIEALRETPLVDYAAVAALKRKVLSRCVKLFEGNGPALDAFRRERPDVETYARFRAAVEKQRQPWRKWPQPMQDGSLPDGCFDDNARLYHIGVQWLAEESMRRLRDAASERGRDLYLDLPLGVHPDGYDAWRYHSVLVEGASAGAPPDTVFAGGQDWGFAPLHPERIRESRYEYVIAYLRHHMRNASLLRLDHVMGLHRLFWIPKGQDRHEGVYVRYRPEEMYAILTLESQRHHSSVVGENLGTVPTYVNPTLDRHGIRRMHVLHYELNADRSPPLNPVPAGSVASLNTHDMPPFASFLAGEDIDERQRLGFLDGVQAAGEHAWRRRQRDALVAYLRRERLLAPDADDPRSILRAALRLLARSPAGVLLVNLEDLWAETRSQNIPGTTDDQRPNWRQRAAHTIEELFAMDDVTALLREVDSHRLEADVR